VTWLTEQGIKARVCGEVIAVDRDSMCNSKFHQGGCPEMTTYPRVLVAIENHFFYPLGYLWEGKTDDELFLNTLGGG